MFVYFHYEQCHYDILVTWAMNIPYYRVYTYIFVFSNGLHCNVQLILIFWQNFLSRLWWEIVFCWNNCSGYSQEKCFKCNLVFPKLSRLKKGQRVKVFWSQGRKKGTEGKVFEAEAVGRGWEMFPEVPFFLPRLQNVYELPFFFQPRCLGINQITRESFSP